MTNALPHTMTMLKARISIGDYNIPRTRKVHERYFAIKSNTTELQQRLDKIKHLVDHKGGLHIQINEFPYDLKDDLVHLVAFYNPEIYSEDIAKLEILRSLSDKNNKLVYPDIIMWSNPVEKQSVTQIPHIHIVVQTWSVENTNKQS
jgi:hypothetical protein